MNTTRTVVFFLFWVALLADCFLIIFQMTDYRIYTKTLLAPLILIGIYLDGINTKRLPYLYKNTPRSSYIDWHLS